MADNSLSSKVGVPVVLPNYEPPTLIAMTNNLTTNATTVAKRSTYFNIAEYDVNVSFTGANTQGVLQLTLPAGDVIDDSVLAVPANLSQNSIPSNVTVADATGISRYRGRVFINTTGSVRVYIDEVIVTTLSVATSGYSNTVDTSANRPITFATGDFVTIRFSVPLVRLAGGMNAYGAGLNANGGSLVNRRINTSKTSALVGATTAPNVTVKQVRVDDQVTLTFPAMAGLVTKNGVAGSLSFAIDPEFTPAAATYLQTYGIVNNIGATYMWYISSGGTVNLLGTVTGSNIAASATNCGWDVRLSLTYGL